MKAIIGALAVTAVFGAAPASAAVDYLLEIGGIKGETTNALVPGGIDIESWSWGLSQAELVSGGSPKVSLQDFFWAQPVDSTTPSLLTWVGIDPLRKRSVKLYSIGTAVDTDYSFFELVFPQTVLSSLSIGGNSTPGSGVWVQATVNMAEATMRYRPSPTANWREGTIAIVNNQLSFSGDYSVLEGFQYAVSGVTPPLPAVPEPGTWALMLGGLGLVGAAALRRRQG